MITATAVLEGIHLVVVVTVVGLTMKATRWFPHVHHGQVLAVDEDMCGLILLSIDIEVT